MASLLLMSASAGSGLDLLTATTVSFVYIAGNSIYIAISEYLSARAHQEFLLSERRRAIWEFKHFKDQEMNEMESRLMNKGMNRKDAELVVQKLAAYENVFVGMMVSS